MDDNEQLLLRLHILEGIGLNNQNHAVVAVASLRDIQLETDITEFTDNPEVIIINSDVIWEISRKCIKKMKTENHPIKIEVFAISWKSEQQIRILIGYILLPIRGVPISMQNKAIESKPRWHKLIGVNQEWRAKKPEILVYLTITKKTIIEETKLMPIERHNTANMLKSQGGIFVKLLQDEGLLQVGDSIDDCDVIIVKLMFKHAAHLEHIVNPEERMNNLFRLHYNLLGTPNLCSLIPKGDGIYSIQEKIAIHFKSSLPSLKEYFNKVLYIPIDLYYNDTLVGQTIFGFENLIQTDDIRVFHSLYGENNTYEKGGTFNIDPLFDLPPTASHPFIEFIFTLRYMSSARLGNCEIIVDKPQIAEYIDNLAGGDNLPEKPMELPTISKQFKKSDNELLSVRSDPILFHLNEVPNVRNSAKDIHERESIKSAPNLIPTTTIDSDTESLLIEKEIPEKYTRNLPRTFSYTLILQNVKFSRRPEVGIWQISLHHPKADTPFAIVSSELTHVTSNLIEFRNLELQLFFASTASEIIGIIESDVCILKIIGPKGMNASAELDNEILLMSTKEKKSGVILMEDESGEKIAMAHIFVYLKDVGINFNCQLKKHTNIKTARPYLDENLAYKIVEELEDWKQNQQELFLVELKRKEVNHLAQLSAEWQKRKYEQETTLADKLEQCSKLTNALEEAYNIVKEKGYDQFEQAKIAEQIKNDLEQVYLGKFAELNEKYRRLENDSLHNLKLEQLRYRELEIQKDQIEKENKKLQEEIEELKQKINEMQKTYLPREQLAGLFQDVRILSERLEETQKSKDFYKDQWAKIIREVHQMKSEELMKMEMHLKKTTSIGLREFLRDEESELLTEREELNFIKTILNANEDLNALPVTSSEKINSDRIEN